MGNNFGMVFPKYDGMLAIFHNMHVDDGETVLEAIESETYSREGFESPETLDECVRTNTVWGIVCTKVPGLEDNLGVFAPTLEDAVRLLNEFYAKKGLD